MKYRNFINTFVAVAIALLFTVQLFAAPLTPGNLVVYRVGDGSAALSNAATAVFLDEYTTAGVLVQSIPLPTAVAGINRRITASGTATSEGFISRTLTGNYLIVGGYDASTGTASITGSNTSTVARVIGRVDVNGIVDSSTAMTEAATPGNIRGVFSTNGTDMWMATSGGGVRYLSLSGLTSTQLSTSPTNTRVPFVYSGQLLVSSSSGVFQGVATVGSLTPTTSGQTTTLLPGFPTTTGPSPYQYAFASGSLLYVADDRATASGGGLQKWTLSGGTWTLTSTYNIGLTAGLRGLSLTTNVLGQVVIYATTADTLPKIVTLVEDGSLVPGFTVIATSATNTAIRSVALTPNTLVGTAAGVTVGGRITDVSGRGLGRVAVTLSGGELAQPLRTLTSPFGYYQFDDLTVGSTYVLSVASKQYSFSPNTRVISLVDAITDIDFTADTPSNGLVSPIIKQR